MNTQEAGGQTYERLKTTTREAFTVDGARVNSTEDETIALQTIYGLFQAAHILIRLRNDLNKEEYRFGNNRYTAWRALWNAKHHIFNQLAIYGQPKENGKQIELEGI